MEQPYCSRFYIFVLVRCHETLYLIVQEADVCARILFNLLDVRKCSFRINFLYNHIHPGGERALYVSILFLQAGKTALCARTLIASSSFRIVLLHSSVPFSSACRILSLNSQDLAYLRVSYGLMAMSYRHTLRTGQIVSTCRNPPMRSSHIRSDVRICGLAARENTQEPDVDMHCP